MRSTITAIMAALSLALLSLGLASCTTTANTPGATPQTTQSNIQKLDMAWLVASSLADTVAVLKPDAAPDIARARAIADVVVREARVQILAASGDTSASIRALTAGLSALAIFREGLVAYREKAQEENGAAAQD